MKFEIRNLKSALIGMLCLFAGQVLAADVKISLESNLISLMDRTVLKIEFIDAKGESVDIPDVEGLEIKAIGNNRQIQIVNGKSTSSITHKYLITPGKIGDYNIGPITAKYRGGQKTETVKLRVIKPKDDPEAQKISELMFSRIETDRTSLFVHEPFKLKLKVYVRDGVQLAGQIGMQGGMPESGLDGEPNWEVTNRSREERNGSIFMVYTLEATAKALTAGTFSFSPEIELNVVIPRQNRRSYGFDDPFFGDFFGRQETRAIVLDCNTLDVQIRPIPDEGRPESFTGGVGILDFKVSVSPTELKAGEPVTIKMNISGDGNLEKIMPPSLDSSPGLKCYDARAVASDHPNEVCFEQVVIPNSDSVIEIPELTFSYFNTKTADFRTLHSGPFPVQVEAAPQQAAQVMAPLATPLSNETRVLGNDIAYLKPAPEHWQIKDGPSSAQRLLYTLPALACACAGWAGTRRRKRESNHDFARRQKAPGAARKPIKEAELALKQNDPTAFYEAVWQTLSAYFGHRFNLPEGAISKQTICEKVPEEQECIARLFEAVEQHRYGIAHSSDTSKMANDLQQLTALLKKCERMKR